MRLSPNEQKKIVDTIISILGESKILLFGSRVDDTKKGGDIDIFVIPNNKEKLLEKKVKALAKLERILHKPIDIVVHKNFDREIEKEITKSSIPLN